MEASIEYATAAAAVAPHAIRALDSITILCDSDISRTTPARVMAAHVPLSFLLLIAAYKTLPVGLLLIALIPASSAVAITPPASRRVNEILQL